MGQISIPIMNKVGFSMFWNSMWDDKHNYSRCLKEDIFIRSFIKLLFEDTPSSNIRFISDKIWQTSSKDFIQKKYNIHLKKDASIFEFRNYLFKSNKLPLYFSKVWILKYQTWIIVYFFIYSTKFNKLLNKQVENDYIDILENNYMFDIISNYHLSFYKSNYKFINYKKHINKKYFF
jgi:hypothetical protein